MGHNVPVFLYIPRVLYILTSGNPSELRFSPVLNTPSIPNGKSRSLPRNSTIPLFYVYDCRSLDIRASHNNYVNRVHQKAFKCPALYCVSIYEIHVYIIWVCCLCMRYMYISSGCFVCV